MEAESTRSSCTGVAAQPFPNRRTIGGVALSRRPRRSLWRSSPRSLLIASLLRPAMSCGSRTRSSAFFSVPESPRPSWQTFGITRRPQLSKLCHSAVDLLEQMGKPGLLILQTLIREVAEWDDLSHLSRSKQSVVVAKASQQALKAARQRLRQSPALPTGTREEQPARARRARKTLRTGPHSPPVV